MIVRFHYYTADAHGMNMVVKATDHACRWIARHLRAQSYQIFSGFESKNTQVAGYLLPVKERRQPLAR